MGRYSLENDNDVLEDVLDEILNSVVSAVDSLTNPTNLASVVTTVKKHLITERTIAKYQDYFIEAFILYKVQRYNIKGKKYISSPCEYYFSDVGLRNAKLNF